MSLQGKLLTPLIILNTVENYADSLQTMIQNDSDFENWYYKNYHKFPFL